MNNRDDLPALILVGLLVLVGVGFWLNAVHKNDQRVLDRGSCAFAACPDCTGDQWAEAYAKCSEIIP
jgi:hypothetical protein